MKIIKYCSLFIFVFNSLSSVPNFVLIGPPGSGKGTFSSFMIKNYGYYQICPGDILRTHIKEETEIGKAIKPIVERGDYINDSIVFRIIEEQIDFCLSNRKPFIIDGFPRSVSSFSFLDDLFRRKSIISDIKYVHFMADDQTCIERIDQRLVCFNCHNVFNNTTRRTKQPMICDECGSGLEIRLGDTVQNTQKRLAYFRQNIEPLIEVAKQYGMPVISIDASSQLESCLEYYVKLMENKS